MGHGVEKAREAFAAAENGADKIERRLVRFQAVQRLWEVPV